MIMLVVQVNACAFEKLFSKLLLVFWISLHQNHMKSDASQYDAFNSSASRMPPAKCLKNLISPTSNLFPTKILLICFCLPCNNNNNHCNLWFFNMLTSISTTTGFFLWFWLQNLLCGWNMLKFNQVPNFYILYLFYSESHPINPFNLSMFKTRLAF